MTVDLDMSQYLDLFVQEAEEGLATLERELLLLERAPTLERIDVVFRAAHTLKGSSRAMGFSGIADVTHEMENVLDAVRGGRLGVTTEMADVLLAGTDALRTRVDGIAGGGNDSAADGALVTRLQGFLGATPSTSSPGDLPSEIEAALRLAASERPVVRARIVLASECVMKYVRAFMAIQAVGEVGELLASIPDARGLEDERFDREFSLFFHSDEALERIEKRLRSVGEIAGVEAVPFGVPGADGSASPAGSDRASRAAVRPSPSVDGHRPR